MTTKAGTHTVKSITFNRCEYNREQHATKKAPKGRRQKFLVHGADGMPVGED